MSVRFIVVPQWQGSGSSRAMRFAEGAEAIRGDLPASATQTVDVPAGAGDALDTPIHRLSSVLTVRERLTSALDTDARPALVIGGDRSAASGALERAAAVGARLVWFDGRAALDPRARDAEHAVLAAALGRGPQPWAPAAALDETRMVAVGVRELTPSEEGPFAGIRSFEATATADDLADALPADVPVHLHVDLSVLDPSELRGTADPLPFGMTAAALTAHIRALAERHPVIGADLTGFAPASADDVIDDAATLLRIVGALSSALASRP